MRKLMLSTVLMVGAAVAQADNGFFYLGAGVTSSSLTDRYNYSPTDLKNTSWKAFAGVRGRLEDDAQGARATDALLEVRKEGGKGNGHCQAEAAASAEEPALTNSLLAGEFVTLQPQSAR